MTAVKISVCKISLEGQTCCTVLYYDNVSKLAFPATEARMESNSFDSLGWRDAVISQVSRAGRGHAQAITEVTARPACDRLRPRTHMHVVTGIQTHTTNIHASRSSSSLINIKTLDLRHRL